MYKFLQEKTGYFFNISTSTLDYLIIALIPTFGMVFNSARKRFSLSEIIIDITTIILFVISIFVIGLYTLTYIGKPSNPYMPQYMLTEPFKLYSTIYLILGIILPFLVRNLFNKYKKNNV